MIRGLNRTTLQTMLCLIILAFVAVSCGDENRLQKVDPQRVEAIEIERVDQLWFDLSLEDRSLKNTQLLHNYGEVYQRYVEDVLQLGNANDSVIDIQINRFVTDPNISEVQSEVQKVYPNLEALSEDLTTAWSYYQHYFPDKTIPKHISVIGGFNTSAILTQNGVGVALEMYLGKNCLFYDYLQLPMYLRNRMTSDHIAPTVLKGWVESEFIAENLSANLLERIIDQGKVLYCLDALFPFMEDSLKIAYSADELSWAKTHESSVWAYFIDNELFFSTDPTQISKFTNDGPFTVDLAKESPSRMGYYIGWQIVRAYMQKQEHIDLVALFNQKDAQYILNNSKYKP